MLERAPHPLYVQLQDYVLALIASGKLRPGDRAPSESELIAQFGVSSTTARRALNELAQQGHLRRVQGMGTFVAKPRQTPRVVAAVLPYALANTSTAYRDVNFFFPAVLDGFRSVMERQGYSVLLQGCGTQDPDALEDLVRNDWQNGVRGIALIAPRTAALPGLPTLTRQMGPLVVIGASLPVPIPQVDNDNVDGAYQAVEHLVQHGHRRIGIITGPVQEAHSRDRLAGYQRCLREYGIPIDQRLICVQPDTTEWDPHFGETALSRLYSVAAPPTAVFAAGFYLALGVYQQAQQLGLAIPDKLSVVGFDDPVTAAFIEPPLTTVAQPLTGLGEQGANLLLKQISGGHRQGQAHNHIVLPTRLQARRSVSEVPNSRLATAP